MVLCLPTGQRVTEWYLDSAVCQTLISKIAHNTSINCTQVLKTPTCFGAEVPSSGCWSVADTVHQWNFRFHKEWVSSCRAERLSAFQGLLCVELLTEATVVSPYHLVYVHPQKSLGDRRIYCFHVYCFTVCVLLS